MSEYTTIPADLRGKSDPDDLWIKAQLIRIDPNIEDHDTEHMVASAMRKLVLEQRDQLAAQADVVAIARKFLDDNHVSCEEACTNDRVYENAPDLAGELGQAIGFYKYPDEGGEA